MKEFLQRDGIVRAVVKNGVLNVKCSIGYGGHNSKKMIQKMMKNELQVGEDEEVVLCYCQVGIMGSLFENF